jgi:hypothetical protein
MKFGGATRGRWAALGLLAMLAVLLQPLCAAYVAAHEADPVALECCADFESGAVAVPSAENAKASAPPPAGAVSATYGVPSPGPHSYRDAAWNDPPPLPSLPYHARSARIQR